MHGVEVMLVACTCLAVCRTALPFWCVIDLAILGEFSSPKQGTFHHYNDFWHLDPSTREWNRLESKGKSPPARSGHRMTYYKVRHSRTL